MIGAPPGVSIQAGHQPADSGRAITNHDGRTAAGNCHQIASHYQQPVVITLEAALNNNCGAVSSRCRIRLMNLFFCGQPN